MKKLILLTLFVFIGSINAQSYDDANEANLPEKSDTVNRRKFENNKSKAKKNRRKNSKFIEVDS